MICLHHNYSKLSVISIKTMLYNSDAQLLILHILSKSTIVGFKSNVTQSYSELNDGFFSL